MLSDVQLQGALNTVITLLAVSLIFPVDAGI